MSAAPAVRAGLNAPANPPGCGQCCPPFVPGQHAADVGGGLTLIKGERRAAENAEILKIDCAARETIMLGLGRVIDAELKRLRSASTRQWTLRTAMLQKCFGGIVTLPI
jgi:hypothetical protein